jgi:hypothetical protein
MSRTDLNRNQNFDGSKNTKLFDLSTGALVSETNTPWVQSHIEEIRNGVVTPGFRSLRGRRKEDLPMNSFFYEKSFWDSPYGRQEIITPSANLRQVDIGSSVGGGWVWNPFVLSNDEKQAVIETAANKLLRGLKDQKVNLGVAFAERKRTSDLFLSTAKRIGDSLRDLKKGNFRSAAHSLTGMAYSGSGPSRSRRKISPSKALANDWLALQYGWKPLLSDVYGAAEGLAANSDRLNRVRVSASHTVRWNVEGDVWGANWDQIPNHARRFGVFTAKYVVVFGNSQPVLNTLSSYGITNPLSVAWEVLPWSFVIDWLWNVGQFIDLLDATVGLSFEKGCLTTFEKGTTRYVCFGRHLDSSSGREVFIDAKASALRVKCVREPIFDFPRPFLPVFSPRITENRLTSAVALLRQRLRT